MFLECFRACALILLSILVHAANASGLHLLLHDADGNPIYNALGSTGMSLFKRAVLMHCRLGSWLWSINYKTLGLVPNGPQAAFLGCPQADP